MLRLVVLGFVLVLAAPASAQQQRLLYSSSAVTTASTTAVAANVSRTFLTLQNISDTAIWCKAGATATVGTGWGFGAASTSGGADGGSMMLDVKWTTQAINCIHGGSATKTLLITEGVK